MSFNILSKFGLPTFNSILEPTIGLADFTNPDLLFLSRKRNALQNKKDGSVLHLVDVKYKWS